MARVLASLVMLAVGLAMILATLEEGTEAGSVSIRGAMIISVMVGYSIPLAFCAILRSSAPSPPPCDDTSAGSSTGPATSSGS